MHGETIKAKVALLLFICFMFLINSEKDTEKASIFNESSHVSYNTHYGINSSPTKIFAIDCRFSCCTWELFFSCLSKGFTVTATFSRCLARRRFLLILMVDLHSIRNLFYFIYIYIYTL